MKSIMLAITLVSGVFLLVPAQQIPAQKKMPVQETELYRETHRFVHARVWLNDRFTLRDAEEAGVEVEHSIIKQGLYVEAHCNAYTLRILRERGIKVEVLIDDVARHHDEILRKAKNNPHTSELKATIQNVPKNFKTGSMGGFYTLEELYEEFKRMRSLYPDLVSEPEEIGRSIENRPLYAWRLGAEKSLAEKKPEVLYTGVHHAREPGSASNLVYYCWWLLEGYASNTAEARYLLNERQLYFIPIVNPDGYAFNQQTNPNGGGMWRKNRRKNADGSFGVDLNRNYGPTDSWNSNNGGSSTTGVSDTYRGTEPFSEPETAAVRDFCNRHTFRTALNYHTYSNLLIYPYSYLNGETADSNYFRALCAEITKVNKYSGGRDLQTVGYAVRGASDDWMYLPDGHQSIMSMTPEVGLVADNFWPSADRIIPHGAENLATNRLTAWSARVNLRPTQVFVSEHPQTLQARINVDVQNLGVEKSSREARLRLTSLTEGISIRLPERTIQPLASTGSQREIFDISIEGIVKNGTRCQVEVEVLQEDVPRRDTVEVQVVQAQRQVLFANSATGWTLNRWALVNDPITGETALTDSPTGFYRSRENNFLQYSSHISLLGIRSAVLEFRTRWSLEANFDFAVVQVSIDTGRTWKSLRSSMMKPGQILPNGSPAGAQMPGTFGFDGNFPLWIRQECLLDDYIGKSILLRFGILSDAGGQFDGWYLSNIGVRVYHDTILSATQRQHNGSALRIVPGVVLGDPEWLVFIPEELIKTSALPRVTVTMYNLLGQRVYETSITAPDGIGVLRNPNLPRGVYNVVVSAAGQSYQQPLLVRE